MFDAAHVWPADQSLARPEDGASLPDGRIVVADEEHGLRMVAADGTHEPFGNFSDVGYRHEPPERPGGASAVVLENDGAHLLVGDAHAGAIYRVNIETQETSLIYDHSYGINGIDQDSRGTIWFTQSTTNTPEKGGVWSALDRPVPTGAVFKLVRDGEGYASTADKVVSDLYLANGIAVDNTGTALYVAEMMMDRVLRYDLDIDNGTVSDRRVHQVVVAPDNLAVDADNNLWIASPGANSVFVVDAKCGSVHPVFRAPSESNAAFLDQWITRSHLDKPRLELITPEAWDPLPGFLTGMFWSRDGETIYFTGVGKAILQYPMR